MLTCVAVSDTHEAHRDLTIPDGDLFIHCGDFTMSGALPAITDFNAWLGELPHRYKIVIGGNHEVGLDRSSGFAKALLSNATYLCDELVTIEGVEIYGSPWVPNLVGWAFYQPPEAMLKKRRQIPVDLDILITHGPPYGILDQLAGSKESVGCKALAAVIPEVCPSVNVFGHIHEGYGASGSNQGTLFINCSIMNEHYRAVNKPVIFEVQ